MEILTIPLGPLQVNCYLVHNGKEAVCIDPGGMPNPIMAVLMREKLELTHILLTHLHADHVYGVRSLHFMTEAPVFASAKDKPLLSLPIGKGGMWGMPEVEPYTFKNIEPGEYPMLNTFCRVIPTPGHTPGGQCYYFSSEGVIFTGDTLFYRSVGRTDLPGGSHETLMRSIETELFPLPAETVVYPGHNDATTIGDERLHNPAFENWH